MNGLLITFGIIVVMSILGYLTQMLKRASDRRQQEQDRERERERRARAALENPNPNPAVPTRQNDLDRYIRAVEAQRQKPVPTARPVARANPVPTVQPARKKPRTNDTPTAFPAAIRGKPTADPVPDDLPVATVVTPRGSVPTAARVQRPEKAATLTPSRSTKSTTPVGRQLSALFASGDAVALAVVLHEVLGPPKCKQAGAGAPGAVASEQTAEKS
jgi:hypothetical protein